MGPSLRRFLLRLLTFFRGGRADAELSREIGSHLQMLEDKFLSQGMSAEEARYAARRAFGGVEQAKEEQREARTFSWLANSKLDLKLGLRMLAKNPGLSLVAVIGMAVAMAIATGYFAVIGAFLDSSLPLEGGDRAVSIRNRVVAGPDAGDELAASARDFLQWREELKSVRELGAFAEVNHNLIIEGRRAELVPVAEMTASGFRLAHVAPELGRPVLDEDELPSAQPVLVIGHEEWQRLFDGDKQVLGRTLQLDGTTHTIVGVMPPGFAFPVHHRFWVPVRLTGPDAATSLRVFGQLADGSTMTDASAELASIGERMAVVFPQTHAKVRPQVLAYTHAFIGIDGPEMELAFRGIQIGVGLLLLVVAVNVAILVYARTATRTGEIAVRTALGASRVRIVSQLFIEALVLSGTAAAVGLALLRLAMAVGRAYHATSTDVDDQLPFWIHLGFSKGVLLYLALLAVVAAVIIGVLPALKVTGKRLQSGLQQFSARGAGMRLGGTWTALIIIQVAIAVAVLPPAMYITYRSLLAGNLQQSPAATGLLRGRLSLARPGAPLARPMNALLDRLRAEPEVAAVTFAQYFPAQEPGADLEVEGDAHNSIDVATNRVATDMFAVLHVPILAGRGFTAGDERPGATATAIVDQTFANRLGGGNVIGRRVRYISVRDGETQRSEWYDIVGVVPAFADTLGFRSTFQPAGARIFHAAAPGDTHPSTLIVRTKGAPGSFEPKLIDIVATVDPALRLERLENVSQAWVHDSGAFRLVGIGVVAVVVSVLLLSAAGIYAMMSFIVNSRRREIGIRAALGANGRRVLLGVFRRAGAQLGAGVVAGLTITVVLDSVMPGGLMGGRAYILLPAVVVLMVTVGLAAAIGPARRSLAIEPAEALRDE